MDKHVHHLIFYILVLFSPGYAIFAVFLFFIGHSTSTILAVSSVHVSEYMKVKHRWLSTLSTSFAFSMGIPYTFITAYFILNRQGWRSYIAVLIVPIVFLAIYLVKLPEFIAIPLHSM